MLSLPTVKITGPPQSFGNIFDNIRNIAARLSEKPIAPVKSQCLEIDSIGSYIVGDTSGEIETSVSFIDEEEASLKIIVVVCAQPGFVPPNRIVKIGSTLKINLIDMFFNVDRQLVPKTITIDRHIFTAPFNETRANMTCSLDLNGVFTFSPRAQKVFTVKIRTEGLSMQFVTGQFEIIGFKPIPTILEMAIPGKLPIEGASRVGYWLHANHTGSKYGEVITDATAGIDTNTISWLKESMYVIGVTKTNEVAVRKIVPHIPKAEGLFSIFPDSTRTLTWEKILGIPQHVCRMDKLPPKLNTENGSITFSKEGVSIVSNKELGTWFPKGFIFSLFGAHNFSINIVTADSTPVPAAERLLFKGDAITYTLPLGAEYTKTPNITGLDVFITKRKTISIGGNVAGKYSFGVPYTMCGETYTHIFKIYCVNVGSETYQTYHIGTWYDFNTVNKFTMDGYPVVATSLFTIREGKLMPLSTGVLDIVNTNGNVTKISFVQKSDIERSFMARSGAVHVYIIGMSYPGTGSAVTGMAGHGLTWNSTDNRFESSVEGTRYYHIHSGGDYFFFLPLTDEMYTFITDTDLELQVSQSSDINQVNSGIMTATGGATSETFSVASNNKTNATVTLSSSAATAENVRIVYIATEDSRTYKNTATGLTDTLTDKPYDAYKITLVRNTTASTFPSSVALPDSGQISATINAVSPDAFMVPNGDSSVQIAPTTTTGDIKITLIQHASGSVSTDSSCSYTLRLMKIDDYLKIQSNWTGLDIEHNVTVTWDYTVNSDIDVSTSDSTSFSPAGGGDFYIHRFGSSQVSNMFDSGTNTVRNVTFPAGTWSVWETTSSSASVRKYTSIVIGNSITATAYVDSTASIRLPINISASDVSTTNYELDFATSYYCKVTVPTGAAIGTYSITIDGKIIITLNVVNYVTEWTCTATAENGSYFLLPNIGGLATTVSVTDIVPSSASVSPSMGSGNLIYLDTSDASACKVTLSGISGSRAAINVTCNLIRTGPDLYKLKSYSGDAYIYEITGGSSNVNSAYLYTNSAELQSLNIGDITYSGSSLSVSSASAPSSVSYVSLTDVSSNMVKKYTEYSPTYVLQSSISTPSPSIAMSYNVTDLKLTYNVYGDMRVPIKCITRHKNGLPHINTANGNLVFNAAVKKAHVPYGSVATIKISGKEYVIGNPTYGPFEDLAVVVEASELPTVTPYTSFTLPGFTSPTDVTDFTLKYGIYNIGSSVSVSARSVSSTGIDAFNIAWFTTSSNIVSKTFVVTFGSLTDSGRMDTISLTSNESKTTTIVSSGTIKDMYMLIPTVKELTSESTVNGSLQFNSFSGTDLKLTRLGTGTFSSTLIIWCTATEYGFVKVNQA